jgi:WD40 repeat protein
METKRIHDSQHGTDGCTFIWNISTSKRLVGPLQHSFAVLVAVRFSPDGACLTTASVGESIQIFNSNNGQQLINIPCPFKHYKSSPLTWSADGHQIFAVSASINRAKCFNTSSGSLVSTWSVPGDSFLFPFIAPSSNQKFIAITGYRSLSFWDASTHQQVGGAIEHSSPVYFMALSPDDDCVVTGEQSGKVTILSLRDILPDSYLTRHVSAFAIAKSWRF